MTTLTAERPPAAEATANINPQIQDAVQPAATASTEAGHDDPVLAALRLLTETEHFISHMDGHGDVPDDVFDAVVLNRKTAASEIAMPFAVTETEHEVVERLDEQGRRQRVILWLGMTALEVAESGYKFHFSAAAHKRIKVEEAEACYAQDELRPGVAQVLISPRMTPHDAPKDIAKAEHLYADDSLRVSTAITNEAGEVVGRRLKSLLVRDVPFEAWIAMLKDPGNIFGKAFNLRDEQSATSVMELFSHMDLPEDKLPEGPISLVEAVLPYITDEDAREKVGQQLERFRGDQEMYAREADRAGLEWAAFDLELARSIKSGWATEAVRVFIEQNTGAWNDESAHIITGHQLADGQYAMTAELAALLARGKQKLIGDQLSVVTGNDEAIQNVPQEARDEIRLIHDVIEEARLSGADPAYIRSLEQRQFQILHRYEIFSGGGCPGEVEKAFSEMGGLLNGVGEKENPFKLIDGDRLGSRWFNCPKGHLNYRRRANEPEETCRKCNIKVDCGMVEEKPKEVAKQEAAWEIILRSGEARKSKQAQVAPGAGKWALFSVN